MVRITRITEEEMQKNAGLRSGQRKLNICITELKSSLREMICALSVLTPVPVREKIPLCTNGFELLYSPEYVTGTLMDELKREIMHITMHGLLGHFTERNDYKDRELSWAVMDLRVEKAAGFFLRAAGGERGTESLWQSRDTIGSRPAVQSDRHIPVGMELYYRAGKDEHLRGRVLRAGERARRDDHDIWKTGMVQGIGQSADTEKNKSGKQDHGESDTDMTRLSELWEAAAQTVKELLKTGKGAAGYTEGDKTLETVLEKMMERSSGWDGSNPEDPGKVLPAQGNPLDYRELLRALEKHAIRSEEADIPDPVMYCYGLDLYGDMALVEPLEEAESSVIGTIAIAVDTSGSCIRDLPVFLRETEALLDRLRETTEVKRIVYLECDTCIQTEEVYEGKEIGRALRTDREYKGGGGTDFCPVFERLERGVSGEFSADVLLYYSDGCGGFPERAPEFPCYFILSDTEWENAEIPKWVNRVYLNIKEEVER